MRRQDGGSRLSRVANRSMSVRGKSRVVKSPTSFLAKSMRSSYSKFGQNNTAGSEKGKRNRARKPNAFNKYDMLKRNTTGPDYTDIAYKEAVSKLKYLLSESYVQHPHPKFLHAPQKLEESDDESGVSIVVSDRMRTARLSPYRRPVMPSKLHAHSEHPKSCPAYPDSGDSILPPAPPELLSFIERQEEYIEQLERESQYCRDELSQLLGKVKDLIAENESLHEQQKAGTLRRVFNDSDDLCVAEYQKDKLRRRLDGPSIVFESRISELEAQLTQGRVDLRKAQDETEGYRRKLLESDPTAASSEFLRQIETLQREKRELVEDLNKIQATMSIVKEKEMDATKRIQRTLDIMDKTAFEKQQAELEVHRLKSELEHQQDKLLEVLSDQTRKVSDERGMAERRYLNHVDQLSSELAAQRDLSTKLQLELEKHMRIEDDLRRELIAKNSTIDQVKKELTSKIGSLQLELTTALTERDSLEQELSTARMSTERSDRFSRQENARLQVEITALKQRMERSDADLIQARRENLRLSDQMGTLDKELTLYKMQYGEKIDINGVKEKNGVDKTVTSVSELEGLVENQGQEMARLRTECDSLTRKLEESTSLHKEEMATVHSNIEYLTSKLESSFNPGQWHPELAPSHHEGYLPDNAYGYENQEQYEEGNYGQEQYQEGPDEQEQLYVQEIPPNNTETERQRTPDIQNQYGQNTYGRYQPEYESKTEQGGQYDTQNRQYDTQQQNYEKQPQNYETQQQNYETQPQNYETQQQNYETQPQNYETQQQNYETQPQKYETQPQTYESQPQPYKAQQQNYETQPQKYESQNYETQPQTYEPQPQNYETQPQNYETKPPSENQPYETQSQEHQTQPQTYSTQPQSHESQPQSHETQPQGHETQPQAPETHPQTLEAEPTALEAQPTPQREVVQPEQQVPQPSVQETPPTKSLQPDPETIPVSKVKESKMAETPKSGSRSNLQTKVQKVNPAVRLQNKQQKPK